MINTQYGNYVKFIRGTEAAWRLIEDSQKSSDTLYFISDTGSASGKLYLGTKLISNGSLSSATSIGDLNDVLIAEGITDQSILVYNSTSEKWENKTILEITQTIYDVFTGASDEAEGTVGLVPAPAVGEQNLFLRGDATWADPVANLMPTIQGMQGQITTMVGEDTGKSIREIATAEASAAVASVIAQAPEQFDTLKEIADWIQSNQGSVDIAGLTTRVTSLEEVIYGVEANEETGTEAVLGLQTIVSNLELSLNSLSETVDTHTTDIADIKDALRWQDIIEENNAE